MNPWKSFPSRLNPVRSYHPPMSSPGAGNPATCRNTFNKRSSSRFRKRAWFSSNCRFIGPSCSCTSPYAKRVRGVETAITGFAAFASAGNERRAHSPAALELAPLRKTLRSISCFILNRLAIEKSFTQEPRSEVLLCQWVIEAIQRGQLTNKRTDARTRPRSGDLHADNHFIPVSIVWILTPFRGKRLLTATHASVSSLHPLSGSFLSCQLLKINK